MGTSQAFRVALHIPVLDPSAAQVVSTSSGGDMYTSAWVTTSGINEAPLDGQQYGRASSAWTVVTPHTWAALSGKPTTFPPAVPIAQSDITDLTTDLDGRVMVAGDTMTGALTVNSTITATGNITAATNFASSTANAILASNGAGVVHLRPNGIGSATGATTISSAGNMAVTGTQFTLAPPAATASAYLTATGAFGAQLFLNKGQAGQTCLIWGRNGALARWYINLGDGAAESGADAGSNFVIAKHNDAGSGATQAFNITRSTGIVGMPFGATTLTPAAGNNSTAVATTAFVTTALTTELSIDCGVMT